MFNLPHLGSAILISLISQFAIAFEFTAVQEKDVTSLREAAFEDKVGYRVVESLTTEVGPRLAGSSAEKRARDWAVKQFISLGFKHVRIEEFDVPIWERGIETAEIISPFPQKLVITALGNSVATPPAGVEGELIRFSSLSELAKVKDQALAGKIIFVDQIMARTQDGSGYGAAVAKRGAATFEGHRTGAAAVLIRSVGTSHDRFAHTGVMKRAAEITKDNSVPAAALSAPDADQLARALKTNKSIRLRMILTPVSMPAGKSGNVIAEIPGSHKPEEIILIGAHLDSWDLGTGAIDDGAGVGIVMAAAHLIKTTIKKPPQRTIRVVLFGAEEIGLFGGKNYSETYQDKLDKHIIAAESDFGADLIWKLSSLNVAEEKLPIINAISAMLAPLTIIAGDNHAYGGPDLHYIKDHGVPLAQLHQNGTDYFDLHHTANDTFDKIDLTKLQQNIAAYAAFTYLVANMDEDFK